MNYEPSVETDRAWDRLLCTQRRVTWLYRAVVALVIGALAAMVYYS